MAFEAKYAGVCRSCDDRIEVGDLITIVDGRVVHQYCAPGAVERPTVTCEKCWLIKPCGCEDEQ